MYIDLHTHSWVLPASGDKAFRSFHQGEAAAFDTWVADCSVGLHPWFVEATTLEVQLLWLKKALQAPNVRLLGEAGLDRLRGPEMPVQQACFEAQLHLAEQFGKPVIIHCVRAFEELRLLLQSVRPRVPLIIHGFNRAPELLRPLLVLGVGCSFGARLFREDRRIREAIQAVPPHLLWLETDAESIPIQQVYAQASKLLGISVLHLQEQIMENSKRIAIL